MVPTSTAASAVARADTPTPDVVPAARLTTAVTHNPPGARAATSGWGWPVAGLLLTVGLLVAGALVGLPFALRPQLAWERVVGLLISGGLAVGTFAALQRLADRHVPAVLLGAAAAALAAGSWIVAIDPLVFRGAVGRVMLAILAPIAGISHRPPDWDLLNTRYMTEYNGLADLAVLALFGAGAALLARPPRRLAIPALATLVVALAVLLGTGSRGALAGLVAGLWTVALLTWRRGWVLAAASTPVVIGLAALGVLDKGLDVTSTAGRLAFWGDYARLLAEFPLTGVGAGIDTANKVAVLYQVNPDASQIAFAHNTLVEAYLEWGPLGALGMLLLPLLAAAGAALAPWDALSRPRRALLAAALGLSTAISVHGLTDQVATTIGGTLLLLVAASTVLACLGPRARRGVGRLVRWGSATLVVTAAATALVLALLPGGRALVLLNVGSLQLTQGLLREDASSLSAAEATFEAALALEPASPALLRNLALARARQFKIAETLDPLTRAASSPRLDAFDMLQVARVYREVGFGAEAYAWALKAYQASGRPAPPAVMRPYRQGTLKDDPVVRTLVEQGEAALARRAFDEALPKFARALELDPENAYLRDRVGDAERGVERQRLSGGQPTR